MNFKKKSIKGVSVAMGIVASFFTPTNEAFPKQKDVLQVISQVKTTSAHLQTQTHQHSQLFFENLAELTNNVALLNAVVRAMKSPDKIVNDLTMIDVVLNRLADEIRNNFAQPLREQQDIRATFRSYVQNVANFSVFTVKLRQEMGIYTLIPNQTEFTQSHLEALIADSNKRYGVNG